MNLGNNLDIIILAFARIASFLFMVPILSGQMIPAMAKIVLSMGLSLAAVGNMKIEIIHSPYEFMGSLVVQIIVGITLAKIVEMLMSIPQIAGAFMDIDMGFSMANLYDPTTKQSNTIMATMLNIMFVVMFIAFDGIKQLIVTIIRSFELTSTLLYLGKSEFLNFVTMTIAYMFSSAVQIALPIMGAMFIVNFVLLIIGKTAPQTQISQNMFTIKISAGLLLLAVTIPILINVFQYLNNQIINDYIESFNYMFKK